MPSRLRKPPLPETPDFWDRLESELRRRVATTPERSQRPSQWMARHLRPLARPLVHGAMAVVALAMVGVLGVPRSNPVADINDGMRSHPTRLTGWVPVVEVEDPRAPVIFYAMGDRVQRFINFVESPTGEQIPVPEDLSAL